MSNFLNLIPGFRSRKGWKMVIASAYYLLSLVGFTNSLSFFIFIAVWPFIIFNLIDWIRQFKNFKKATEGVNEERKQFNLTAMKVIFSAVILCVSIAAMPKNENTSKPVANNSSTVIQQENTTTQVAATSTPTATIKPTSVPTPTPAPIKKVDPKADFPNMDLTKENIQAAIIDTVGKDKLKVVEITQEKGLTIVDVTIDPGTVWDEKALVRTTATTACNVMEILFTNPKVDKVWLWTQTKMIDAKGNEKTENVVNVALTRENAKDINWPKFKEMVMIDYNKLFSIADGKYIHPGIQKALK